MDAVRRFQDKCGNVFRLLVVGEGGERKNLMDYCKRIGLEDTVVFVGGVPNEEVKNYLFASDLFLFSSRSETQGIVLAEAMAAGLPVVALESYGVNDIVRNGYNGLLCEESVEAFTENVETMLKDRSLYEKLKRRRGRNRKFLIGGGNSQRSGKRVSISTKVCHGKGEYLWTRNL